MRPNENIYITKVDTLVPGQKIWSRPGTYFAQILKEKDLLDNFERENLKKDSLINKIWRYAITEDIDQYLKNNVDGKTLKDLRKLSRFVQLWYTASQEIFENVTKSKRKTNIVSWVSIGWIEDVIKSLNAAHVEMYGYNQYWEAVNLDNTRERRSYMAILAKSSLGIYPNILSGILGKNYQIPYTDTRSEACGSGAAAIISAIKSLNNNEFDSSVVVSAESWTTYLSCLGFAYGWAMSSNSKSAPYTKNRNWFIWSEWAGVALIEKDITWKAMIWTPIAKVLAYDSCNSQNHIFQPDPVQAEEIVRNLYKMTWREIWSVDYYNTHGTGTKDWDTSELTGIYNANHWELSKDSIVHSSKWYHGHPLWSAWPIELAIELSLLRQWKIFPNRTHFSDTHNRTLDTSLPLSSHILMWVEKYITQSKISWKRIFKTTFAIWWQGYGLALEMV